MRDQKKANKTDTRDPRMPRRGKRVARRYRVLDKLGAGGFASVFLAYDKKEKRNVALKIMDPLRSNDPNVHERFQREIRLTRRLTHKNTIRLFDSGELTNGCRFLAMEHVDGSDLSEVIAAHGGLPVERAIGIAAQILGSLGEAHSLGIVHRDLKPANVMLCRENGRDLVKVLDFGIAKAMERETLDFLTQDGKALFTPNYAAPESWEGKAVPASDLYAVGLLLSEMITGQVVIQASSIQGYFAKHCSRDPIPVPRIVAGGPLGPVIAKATAKDLADRYSTARDMYDDLVAVVRVINPRSQLILAGPWEDGLADQATQPAFDSLDGLADTAVREPVQRAPLAQHVTRAAFAIACLLIAASAFLILYSRDGQPAAVPLTGAPNGRVTEGSGQGETADADSAGGEQHAVTAPGDQSDVSHALEGTGDHVVSAPGGTDIEHPADYPVAAETVALDIILVDVDSTPSGADVRINGTLVGQTPLSASHPRTEEAIPLEVSLEGYRSWRRELAFGDDVRVTADLQRPSTRSTPRPDRSAQSSDEREARQNRTPPEPEPPADAAPVDASVFQVVPSSR